MLSSIIKMRKCIFQITDNLVKENGAEKLARHFSVSNKLLSWRPEITKPAPEFAGTAVVNGDFKDIKLADYRGKYVVLLFYPLDL